VLDGTIQDGAFFAYISAAAPDADWTDPEVWKAANPSFAANIPRSFFTNRDSAPLFAISRIIAE